MSNARKAVDRQDVAYVVVCMFRAVGVLAPDTFARRVAMTFDLAGRTAEQFDSVCAQLEALIDETLKRLT